MRKALGTHPLYAELDSLQPHCVAAAFFYGREDIIPDMFGAFVNRLHQESRPELERFVYYIDRHIEVDGESHGPLARHMTTMLCQRNRTDHKEAADVALQSLSSRLQLWTACSRRSRQPSAASGGRRRRRPRWRGGHGAACTASRSILPAPLEMLSGFVLAC